MPSIKLQAEALAHIMSRVMLKEPKDASKQIIDYMLNLEGQHDSLGAME